MWLGSLLLAEASRVRMSIAGNNRRVVTMRRGLAGRSRGPVESEISIDSAVPVEGLEDTFVEKIIDNADVRVTIDLAGKRYGFDGWVEDGDAEQSTDGSASFSFRVVAGPPRIL